MSKIRVLLADDQDVIRAGAIGYLLKDTSKDKLADAARGESQIDPMVARKVLHEFQQIGACPSVSQPPIVEGELLEELTDR